MMNEPMKMLIFFVALCFLLFCSAKHLCFTLKTAKRLLACFLPQLYTVRTHAVNYLG